METFEDRRVKEQTVGFRGEERQCRRKESSYTRRGNLELKSTKSCKGCNEKDTKETPKGLHLSVWGVSVRVKSILLFQITEDSF